MTANASYKTKIKAIGFDLDNTLYPEADYRRGAYRSLANRVAKDFGLDPRVVYEHLEASYQLYGDKQVFQKAFEALGISASELDDYIRGVLVPGYRTWSGNIRTFPSSVPTLRELKRRGYRLGLITNGGSVTQWNKIRLLNLEGYFDAIVVTGEYFPKEYWKPHPAPFEKCFAELGVDPSECVYVGDDPRFDLPGARALGVHVFLVGSSTLAASVAKEECTVISDLRCLLDYL